jgi:hypothetical protein
MIRAYGFRNFHGGIHCFRINEFSAPVLANLGEQRPEISSKSANGGQNRSSEAFYYENFPETASQQTGHTAS